RRRLLLGRRHAVIAADPARQVDGLAARRTEWTEARLRLLAADRARARGWLLGPGHLQPRFLPPSNFAIAARGSSLCHASAKASIPAAIASRNGNSSCRAISSFCTRAALAPLARIASSHSPTA